MSLQCGSELQGPRMHLKSDLATCATQLPIVLDFVLPAPLNYLFSKLHDLPRVFSADSAKLELLENVQIELTQLPEYKRRNLEETNKIATTIINRRATPDWQLSYRLDATVGWPTYITYLFFSLLFSFTIHFLISYVFTKYRKLHRRFSFRLTHISREIKTFPVTAVTPEGYEYLCLHLYRPLHLKMFSFALWSTSFFYIQISRDDCHSGD